MSRLAFAAVVLVSTVAHAQIGPRTGGPAPGDLAGTQAALDLSLTGNAARGLVDRDLVAARGSLTLWSGPWGLFVQPYWLYGDVAGTKTDDERYLRALAFRAVSGPIFAFGVAVYDHSLRRRIDRRGLAGGGAGATLVHGDAATLVASAGVLGEIADFGANQLMDGTVVPPSRRVLARASLRIYGRYKLLHGRVVLLHDLYLLPAVRDLGDTRALLSGVADVPIAAGLSARVQVDASYEQYVVPGTKHDDIALTFGAAFRGGRAF